MTRRLLLLPLSLAAALLPAAGASAAVTCGYDAAKEKVFVNATSSADSPELERQAGSHKILVDNVACGAATVLNTDSILFTDISGGSSNLTVDLSNGALAPGATAEANGESEIEIQAALDAPGEDVVVVYGAPLVRAGSIAGDAAIDLNPGEGVQDADITGAGIDAIVYDAPAVGGSFLTEAVSAPFDGPLAVKASLQGSVGTDVLQGGTKNDYILARGGGDSISGGAGNDVLFPREGDDTVDGGPGTDRVSYSDLQLGGVKVRLLEEGAQDTGAGGSDTLKDVEDVYGTDSPDVLRGTNGSNIIDGLGGDDRIAGLGGNDKLWGGSGRDTVTYANSVGLQEDTDAGVQVDLATGLVSGDHGADVLSGFEDVVGSAQRDVLLGDGEANVLDGGPAADEIGAGDGADTVAARDGAADTVDCGAGTDKAVADRLSVDTLGGCETVDALPEPAAPQAPVSETTTPVETTTTPVETTPVTPTQTATETQTRVDPPVPPRVDPPIVATQAPRALRLTLTAAKRLRRGRLVAKARCDAACTVKLRAVVRVRGKRTVVRATRRLGAGRRTTIALRLPKGARRVSLRATATAPGLAPAKAAKRVRVR